MAAAEGVLLYYKYCDLTTCRQEVSDWIQELCARLHLKGRIRVALDGINVTVGGEMSGLESHIAAVKEHEVIQGSDIDFKLAASSGALNSQCQVDSGFDTLVVRQCEELVSLGSRAANRAHPANGGTHLDPHEFHHQLLAAGEGDRPTVLVDTRNIYESRIGHFQADGIELLRPPTRCFSDFPAWVDANAAQLRGKRIMMYCTGGVRCERASAYVRELGAGFEDVFQLRGGIQRYLEAFAEGGLFRGKNFVFDERVAVGAAAASPPTCVGRCLLCEAPCDDYGPRFRCHRCRLLVLVCPTCTTRPPHPTPPPAGTTKASEPEESLNNAVAAPATTSNGAHTDRLASTSFSEPNISSAGTPAGTLQHGDPHERSLSDTASCEALIDAKASVLSAAALERTPPGGAGQEGPACADEAADWALRHLVCEMCRAKAEHSSPAVRSKGRRRSTNGSCGKRGNAERMSANCRADAGTAPTNQEHRRLRMLVLHGFRENSSRSRGRLRGLIKRIKHQVDLVFIDAPHALPDAPRAVPASTCTTRNSAACARNDNAATDEAEPCSSADAVRCEARVAGSCKGSAQCCTSDARELCAEHATPHESDVSQHGMHKLWTDTVGSPLASSESRERASHGCGKRDTEAHVAVGPQRCSQGGSAVCGGTLVDEGAMACAGSRPSQRKFAWFIDLHSNADSRSSGDTHLAGHSATGNAEQLPQLDAASCSRHSPAGEGQCSQAPPMAVLRGAEDAQAVGGGSLGACVEGTSDARFGKAQHRLQVAGWQESLDAVRAAVHQHGEFDGVLGFSQGCSMAALLLALQQLHDLEPEERGVMLRQVSCAAPRSKSSSTLDAEMATSHPCDGIGGSEAEDLRADLLAEAARCTWNFRFAMMCSGYVSECPALQVLLTALGPLKVPSLHVFGTGGDRQVYEQESRRLVGAFDSMSRRVMTHGKGHIIPSSRGDAAAYVDAFSVACEFPMVT